VQVCVLREKAHQKKNFTPEGSIDNLASGTYYLTEVDDMFRRKYEIKAWGSGEDEHLHNSEQASGFDCIRFGISAIRAAQHVSS
jgi:hypothetical protein